MITLLALMIIVYGVLWILSFFDTIELIEMVKFEGGKHVSKYTKKQIRTNFFIPFYIRLTELYTKYNNLK